MSLAQRVAQGLMVLLGALIIVILASVYADTGEDNFPADAKVLIATGGTGFGLLVIVLAVAGINSGERWAWLALWVLPAFFVSHVALLGTWVPDAVFAALSIIALLATRPRYGSRHQPATTMASERTTP